MLGYVTHETEGIIFHSVHQKILKLLTIEREFYDHSEVNSTNYSESRPRWSITARETHY